jgi:hypothetical protein
MNVEILQREATIEEVDDGGKVAKKQRVAMVGWKGEVVVLKMRCFFFFFFFFFFSH